jgi:hypothetical protein
LLEDILDLELDVVEIIGRVGILQLGCGYFPNNFVVKVSLVAFKATS